MTGAAPKVDGTETLAERTGRPVRRSRWFCYCCKRIILGPAITISTVAKNGCR